MDNKALLDALAQIPDLIKAAETYKATSERIISTLAEAVKKRPQAVIPEEELEKTKKAIQETRCAQPDITLISRELAWRISEDVSDAIKPALRTAAAEALRAESVNVEHSHVIERNLWSIVDEKMKKKVRILWIIIIVLFGAIGISAISFFNSETHWGQEFYELYSSKYITADEKAALERSVGYTGVLPLGYYEDPVAARAQLKRNKDILKMREKEAKKNKGKFSTDEPIQTK